jgi:two-component system CheB/CheR fusion protein
VLTGLDASVIVVDTELKVRVWNGLSFEMWGLRPEEAEGRVLLTLDIGFPLEALRPAIVATLAGEPSGDPIAADATSRRGHPINCIARVRGLRGATSKIEGAIVLINEVSHEW